MKKTMMIVSLMILTSSVALAQTSNLSRSTYSTYKPTMPAKAPAVAIKPKPVTATPSKFNRFTTKADAVGSKVWLSYEVEGKTETQYREMRLSNGFMAMGDARMLFGLGYKKVSNIKVSVLWHDGQKAVFDNVKMNQYHILKE